MRDMKFRGQKIGTKEWLYGGYSKHIKDKNRTFITIMSKDHLSDIGWHQEVIPETVGQFTGLFDKNGKKIYEGDIITWLTPFGKKYVAIVIYDNEIAGFRTYKGELSHISIRPNLEVIGNATDNRNLLSKQN